MIGSIISAGVGAIGSIVGGLSARKAAKQANKIIDKQMEENQAWYDRKYNENYLERSDALATLNKTRDLALEHYNRAEAAGVVSGATDESIALQKKAANDMIAETTASIAKDASAYKDAVEQQYMSTKDQLNQSKRDVLNQKASNINNAIQGLTGVASSVVTADALGAFKKRKGA